MMNAVRHKHSSGHATPEPLQPEVENYLLNFGLSFDFDAGRERYDYQVAIGSERPDAMLGDAARDYLWGMGGDDRIDAGEQDDVAYGDAGADLLIGRDGADRLSGGSGEDRLFGGAQADALRGGPGADYLDEGVGHGDLDGGPGADVLIGGPGPDAFAVDRMSGDDVIRDFTAGPGMFDHLALRDLRWADLGFEDTADGVRVSWDGGSVLLQGVRRADLAQDDFMFADSPDLPPGTRAPAGPADERASPMSSEGPAIDGDLPGADFDRLADRALRRGEVELRFSGEEDYVVTIGERGADRLSGSAAADHLFGRDGNDFLRGAAGDDVLQGDAGDDLLRGGDGMDRLDGGMGRDRLYGGAMADELMGMDGRDFLDGGAGHDMIEGGRGNDVIRGGAGADAFIVDPDSGFDWVLDFEARGLAQGAFDHLALRDIRPNQVSVFDTPAGAWVKWNTDAHADFDGGVLLQGVAKSELRQSDFMFVGEPGFVNDINSYGSWYVFDPLIG